MRNLIPWWLKIGFKIVLSRVPVNYKFWQSVGLFRHGEMDQSAYALDIFRLHVERAGLGERLSGKTVLELGPGDSVATAIIAASCGAKSVLIDAGDFASKDLHYYRYLETYLTRLGLSPPDLSGAKNLDDILELCNSQYLTRGLRSIEGVKSESIDLIFSQAVLEHVRHREFFETMSNCYRVLSVDGMASHRIDLKDHLGGGLNNLRFRESLWESEFFAKSGFYTNRIRYPQMISSFESVGFEINFLELDQWDELPINRSHLDSTFSGITNDDLRVSGIDVVLKKNR